VFVISVIEVHAGSDTSSEKAAKLEGSFDVATLKSFVLRRTRLRK